MWQNWGEKNQNTNVAYLYEVTGDLFLPFYFLKILQWTLFLKTEKKYKSTSCKIQLNEENTENEKYEENQHATEMKSK